MKLYLTLLFLISNCTTSFSAIGNEKITFKTTDNLTVTADLYRNDNPNVNVIILCHQAGFSRGEYIETAEKLLTIGYTCLALDQRSGKEVNSVANETAKLAKELGLKQEYPNALLDIEAGLKYVKENFPKAKIMLVGSSYSASLAIIIASKYPKDIKAIASFSPGEYFKIDNLTIEDFAKNVNCAVFITSAKNEGKNWKVIYNVIPSKNKTSFLPNAKGIHGSKALWSSSNGNQEYWMAFKLFLANSFKSS